MTCVLALPLKAEEPSDPMIAVELNNGERLQQRFANSALARYWDEFLSSELASDWTRVSMRSQESLGSSPEQLLKSLRRARVSLRFGDTVPSISAIFQPQAEPTQRLWGALLQRMQAKLLGGKHPAIAVNKWAVQRSGDRFDAVPFWRWNGMAPRLDQQANDDLTLRVQLPARFSRLPESLALRLGLSFTEAGSQSQGTITGPALPLETVDSSVMKRLPRGVLGVAAIALGSDQNAITKHIYSTIRSSLAELHVTLPAEQPAGLHGTIMVLVSFGGYLPALTVSIPDQPGMADIIQSAFKNPINLQQAAERTVTIMLPGPTPLWIRYYENRWYFSRDQVVLTHLCGRNLLPPSPLLNLLSKDDTALFAAIDTQNVAGLLLSDLPLRMRDLPSSDQKQLRRWQRGLRPLVDELTPLSFHLESQDDGRYAIRARNMLLPASIAGLTWHWWQHLEQMNQRRQGERWLSVLLDGIERWRDDNERNWPQVTDLSVLHGKRALAELAKTLYIVPQNGVVANHHPIAVDTPERLGGHATMVLFPDGTTAEVPGLQVWHEARRLARAQANGMVPDQAWQRVEHQLKTIYQMSLESEP